MNGNERQVKQEQGKMRGVEVAVRRVGGGGSDVIEDK